MSKENGTRGYGNDELTDKEEVYCQKRAMGFTKTRAAAIAYDTKNPSVIGSQLETKDKIKRRIQELKFERTELDDLDGKEILRMYQDIYQGAVLSGNQNVALKALDRIAEITGYDKNIDLRDKTMTEDSYAKSVERDVDSLKDILGSA